MSSKSYSINVEVKSKYLDEASRPDEGIYAFSYRVAMENTGRVPAKLLGRRWVLTDSNGQVTEVIGEGVVGEFPYLRPGERFEYTSRATIATPVGTMAGSYQMLAEDGVPFDAPIDTIRLVYLKRLH